MEKYFVLKKKNFKWIGIIYRFFCFNGMVFWCCSRKYRWNFFSFDYVFWIGGKWILSDFYDFIVWKNWYLKIKGKKKVE